MHSEPDQSVTLKRSSDDINQDEVVLEPVEIKSALIELVSERTGYPIEMLSLDLDLESDLSVDSIKRIEILGALAERIGLTGGDESERDEMIEELAIMKTLSEMISWLEARLSSATSLSKDHDSSEKPLEEDMRPKAEGERLPRSTKSWLVAPLSPLSPNSHVNFEEIEVIDLITSDTDHPLTLLFERVKTIAKELEVNESSPLAPPTLLVIMPLIRSFDEAIRFGGVSGLLKSALLEWREREPRSNIRLISIPSGLSERQKESFFSAEINDMRSSVAEQEDPDQPILTPIRYRESEGTFIRERERYISDPLSFERPESKRTRQERPELIMVTGGARGVTAECLQHLAEREPAHVFIARSNPTPSERITS